MVLQHLTADPSAVSPDEIITLLKFGLDATDLAYKGKVYQQVYGTAMGSPVSVAVANLVMDVEQRALNHLRISIPILEMLCG